MCTRRRNAAGFSLIEQVMVIVVISVGVIGLLSVMNVSIFHSGDPMMRKQMMAVAESLLSEIQHQPFTWCDPDDPAASSALSSADCAAVNRQDKDGVAALDSSSPAGESRIGGAGTQFDNVADYGGYTQTPPTDAAGGNALTGIAPVTYSTAVEITRFDGNNALQITVTVTNTATSETVSLTGYRYRYAPRY